MLFWPSDSTRNCSRSDGVLPAPRKRAVSLFSDESSTAIYSGQTLTSPTAYLEILGTAAARDSCGPLGSTYTNPIIAIGTEGFSSLSWDVPLGGTFIPKSFPGDTTIHTKPVNTADLACPTWGIGTGFHTAERGQFLVVEPPFNPIILAPKELLSYDPAWANCPYFESDTPWVITNGIFDPPFALSAHPEILPSPVALPASAATGDTHTPAGGPIITPSAQPVSIVASGMPPLTRQSILDPRPTPPADPGRPLASDSGQGKPSNQGQQPSSDPSKPPLVSPAQPQADNVRVSAVADPGIVPNAQAGNSPGQNSYDSRNQPRSQGIGAAIIDGMGGSGGVLSPNGDPIADPGLILTVGGSVLAAKPSAFSVAGTPVSLGASGVVVGGSTVNLPAPTSAPVPPTVITAGGQPITIIDGSAIAVGGSAVAAITISGTPISLAPSGILVVGTSSIRLSQPTVFTVADQTFTAVASAFSIDGTTISAGGPGVTISGTPVSLGSSGILVVGTNTISLSGPASTIQPFQGAQGRTEATTFAGSLWILGVSVVLGAILFM